MEVTMQNEILTLVERVKSMLLCTEGPDAPLMKAVSRMGQDGPFTLYFNTDVQSEFMRAYNQCGKAALYLYDDDPAVPFPSDKEKYYSLYLVGKIETETDATIKRRLYRSAWDVYYPLGADDPGFQVLKFKAASGTYRRYITGDTHKASFTV